MKLAAIELSDDFKQGDCKYCPFSNTFYSARICLFNWWDKDCDLIIQEEEGNNDKINEY